MSTKHLGSWINSAILTLTIMTESERERLKLVSDKDRSRHCRLFRKSLKNGQSFF